MITDNAQPCQGTAPVCPTDDQLVAEYHASGCQDSFSELFRRNEERIFAICSGYFPRHEDARDATMEIMERLLQTLQTSTPNRFYSWLYTVCVNHCRNKIRKRRIRTEPIDKFEIACQEEIETVEIRECRLNLLEFAVKLLPLEQRTCIELFYYEEKTYKQISEHTGWAMKAVKSYLQNGKRNLRNMLQED